MAMADELAKLHQLHQSGGISDEEYATAKARVLEGGSAYGNGASAPQPIVSANLDDQTRQWALLLHLSQFAGIVVPAIGGVIAPILIWQLKKNELPGIDAHGKVVANWLISAFIYGLGCAILCILLIGIPMFFALLIMAIVFPIIGAVKANNGELWKYPLSMEFFK